MDYKKLYDKLYEMPYQRNWLGKNKVYDEQVRLATALVNSSMLFDLGCGEVIITSRLNGKRIIGLDVSKNAIRYANKNIQNEEIHFMVASAYQLPFLDNSFDCVSAIEVIEHITSEDMNKCLREIQRVCKPDGRVVISTPNLSSLFYATFRSMRIKSEEHINEMDFIQKINVLTHYFTVVSLHSHIETPWLGKVWLTRYISKIQKMLIKRFPPIKSLLYNQLYIVMRNTVI